mmetsp:Transcript_18075/g.43193  ORF Transcript_18075/g.43193 Transcript_18075/m.43193 type:complete len:313 (+) Transcript_18075:3867-4805(+)
MQASPAECLDQHETNRAGLGLFVDSHQLQVALAAELGRLNRQASTLDQPAQPFDKACGHQAHALRQVRSQHHAAGYRLTMEPNPITQACLDGMPDGVTEVENGPQALLAFVRAHHVGLDLAAAPHRVAEHRLVARQQRVEVVFDPAQKAWIGDRPVLDHFSQTGAQLPFRQAVQRGKVRDDPLWLIERAKHVLAERVIDGRLATNRRIDLGKQRGRHLHKRHTTHIDGRSEAGHVTDHATTEGEQHGLAVQGLTQQMVADAIQAGPVLVLFAIGQRHEVHTRIEGLELPAQTFGIERRHGFIADDDRSTCVG